MTDHPPQSAALDTQRDEQKPDERGLLLDAPCTTLVSADPILLGMQMGNLILSAVYGVKRIER